MPTSSESSRPRMELDRVTVWLGIKALLGFLEPHAFEEGILERYSSFVSIVLNHISDDSFEFSYAINCLRLLFDMLGCKLWLRATLSPSVTNRRVYDSRGSVKCSDIWGALLGFYGLCSGIALGDSWISPEDFMVWDIRSKMQIHALSGHDNTVCSVFTRPTDPQVITGSHDSTIKFWDLRYGKTMATLTHHKKSVRALAQHPSEDSFASASADNIKKFSLPRGEFLHNMLSQQKTIINAMTVNQDGVLATGGLSIDNDLFDEKVTMGTCGSGTGKVVIVSNNPKHV